MNADKTKLLKHGGTFAPLKRKHKTKPKFTAEAAESAEKCGKGDELLTTDDADQTDER
jgi:hypothetical protein